MPPTNAAAPPSHGAKGYNTSAMSAAMYPPLLKLICFGNTFAKSNAGETKLATTLIPSVARNPAAEGEASRLHNKVDGENEHHDPHRGPCPVLEPAYRLHAALDDQELQRPDDHEADHLQPGMAEEMAALVECHDGVRAR